MANRIMKAELKRILLETARMEDKIMAKGITKAELQRVYDIAMKHEPEEWPKEYAERMQETRRWKQVVAEEAGVSLDRAQTAVVNVIMRTRMNQKLHGME